MYRQTELGKGAFTNDLQFDKAKKEGYDFKRDFLRLGPKSGAR